MSLTDLPPELLGCLAANIASNSGLCNLARCSHWLYGCTIWYFYRHVTIQKRIGQGEQQHGGLRNLASTLTRRSDIAGFVLVLV